MKSLFKTRLWTLVCIAVLMGIAVSCNKDDDASPGKVELLSYGPAGVKHGEKISFIGRNLDKVTSIELSGATVSQSDFIEQTADHIAIIVPQEALRGKVILKSPEGDIESKAFIDFNVPVKITSVTASVKPGDNITIKGEHVNWISSVLFAKDILVTEFVSKSLTELVVKVPMSAQSGTLVFSTGGTEPVTIESATELNVVLPAITEISPVPIEKQGNLTIKGSNLDLVMGVSFKGVAQPVAEFVSRTATELVVKVPAKASKGKISLVSYSGIAIESTSPLLFIGDLPDLQPLGYAFYVDGFQNNAQSWSWGSTLDFANTENVRDGNASIKATYKGGWGALKFANLSAATAAYSTIVFSVYGTPGTDGKQLAVTANSGPQYRVAIEEGKWVEFSIPKAELGNPGTITGLMLQDTDWSGTVYVDHVGLR